MDEPLKVTAISRTQENDRVLLVGLNRPFTDDEMRECGNALWLVSEKPLTPDVPFVNQDLLEDLKQMTGALNFAYRRPVLLKAVLTIEKLETENRALRAMVLAATGPLQ